MKNTFLRVKTFFLSCRVLAKGEKAFSSIGEESLVSSFLFGLSIKRGILSFLSLRSLVRSLPQVCEVNSSASKQKLLQVIENNLAKELELKKPSHRRLHLLLCCYRHLSRVATMNRLMILDFVSRSLINLVPSRELSLAQVESVYCLSRVVRVDPQVRGVLRLLAENNTSVSLELLDLISSEETWSSKEARGLYLELCPTVFKRIVGDEELLMTVGFNNERDRIVNAGFQRLWRVLTESKRTADRGMLKALASLFPLLVPTLENYYVSKLLREVIFDTLLLLTESGVVDKKSKTAFREFCSSCVPDTAAGNAAAFTSKRQFLQRAIVALGVIGTKKSTVALSRTLCWERIAAQYSLSAEFAEKLALEALRSLEKIDDFEEVALGILGGLSQSIDLSDQIINGKLVNLQINREGREGSHLLAASFLARNSDSLIPAFETALLRAKDELAVDLAKGLLCCVSEKTPQEQEEVVLRTLMGASTPTTAQYFLLLRCYKNLSPDATMVVTILALSSNKKVVELAQKWLVERGVASGENPEPPRSGEADFSADEDDLLGVIVA